MNWIKRRLSIKICIIPQRYIFAIMGFLATTIVYLVRYSVVIATNNMAYRSSAIANMETENYQKNISVNNITDSTLECYNENNPFCWEIEEQYDLMQGFIRSYIVTQFFGGQLSDMKGGKKILGGGILISSICTFIIPFIAPFGVNAVYYVRIISGMSCGATFPALMAMMSQWVPPNERAQLGTLIYSGIYAGNIIGPSLSHFIKLNIHSSGWNVVFYTFGLIGIFWFGFWYALCYSSPNIHPFISEKEKLFLNDNVVALQRTSKVDELPWKAFLRCGPFWAAAAIFVGRDCCFQTLTACILRYFFSTPDVVSSGRLLLFSFLYFGVWVSTLLFGFSSDYCVNKKYFSTSVARKLFSSVAVAGSSLCLSIGICAGFNTIGISVFILGITLNGAFYCGAWINFLDIVPSYAGTMLAIADNIPILITNYLIPLFYAWISYEIMFWILLCLVLLSNIIYAIYGNSKHAWWDDVRKLGYPSNWKHGNLTTTIEIIVNEEIVDEDTSNTHNPRENNQ